MEMIIKLKDGCLEIPQQIREQMKIEGNDEMILTSNGDQLIIKLKAEQSVKQGEKTKNNSNKKTPGVDEDLRWKEQMNFWHQNKQKFISDPQFNGKYIAISNFQIIGSAKDKFELFRITHQKYPNEYFIIVNAIAEEENLKHYIESPRVRR